MAWLAAVAVLATALVWLAAAGLVLILASSNVQAPPLVMLRALGRAALALLRHGAPLLPPALLACVLAGALVRSLLRGVAIRREVRHA
ncbi:MAG: hypothetical protein A2W00_13960 [Candidatus Eisenbacteria bacterium RBG_16_71_46]|nr:MAG: hypothetical protein A2W00_13960 [Candidatus Eisenbacteria bacterium RBG_16_71_46]